MGLWSKYCEGIWRVESFLSETVMESATGTTVAAINPFAVPLNASWL